MMKRYVRHSGGIVREIVEIPEDADISDRFHPDVVAGMVEDAKGDAVVCGTWDGTRFGSVPVHSPSIAGAKAEARRRIAVIAPDWKQRNLLAEASGRGPWWRALWSAEERMRKKQARDIWSRVKQIRDASNRLEHEILTGSFDGDPAQWSGWPE